MSKPLFADSWYDTPRVNELRQEIQRLYEIIRELEEKLEELQEQVDALP